MQYILILTHIRDPSSESTMYSCRGLPLALSKNLVEPNDSFDYAGLANNTHPLQQSVASNRGVCRRHSLPNRCDN